MIVYLYAIFDRGPKQREQMLHNLHINAVLRAYTIETRIESQQQRRKTWWKCKKMWNFLSTVTPQISNSKAEKQCIKNIRRLKIRKLMERLPQESLQKFQNPNIWQKREIFSVKGRIQRKRQPATIVLSSSTSPTRYLHPLHTHLEGVAFSNMWRAPHSKSRRRLHHPSRDHLSTMSSHTQNIHQPRGLQTH